MYPNRFSPENLVDADGMPITPRGRHAISRARGAAATAAPRPMDPLNELRALWARDDAERSERERYPPIADVSRQARIELNAEQWRRLLAHARVSSDGLETGGMLNGRVGDFETLGGDRQVRIEMVLG